MGNEKSALSGLKIDEKAVEITDFWVHHSATISNPNHPQILSVFVSEPSLHSAASFGKPSPLQKNAKNLMLHRHPCILKYISSWEKGSKFFLTTEQVKPLVQVIGDQTILQICIGLHSILRALIFLQEVAGTSHNNICSSSIYVTPEGTWKLGSLEHLCKFDQLTPSYLKKIKSYRYEKAISPDEDTIVATPDSDLTNIDRFAFAILAEEVLRLKDSDLVPSLSEFKEFCKQQLQVIELGLRPSLSSVISHPFFTHDFIKTYAFLIELPLKQEAEKEEFFSNLLEQLRAFPEKVVAEQLGKLLLSRLVLLDSTAQSKLLPFVLKPKQENDENDPSLFSLSTYRVHLVPKLMQMFCVRDASIRLLLLSHLTNFIHAFHIDELKSHVLPELLVGIKDTDDYLVSTTLRALAVLVPILGASTVIGGNRARLFTDGRPNKVKKRGEGSSTKGLPENLQVHRLATTDTLLVDLPERPSPDGGEDRIDSNAIYTEEEATWSDWDAHETTGNGKIANGTFETSQVLVESVGKLNSKADEETVISPSPVKQSKYSKKSIISDITELDIKHSKPLKSDSTEIDFFTDMQPVIQKTQLVHIDENEEKSSNKCDGKSISKFDVKVVEQGDDTEDNGWGDDLNDWGTDERLQLQDD